MAALFLASYKIINGLLWEADHFMALFFHEKENTHGGFVWGPCMKYTLFLWLYKRRLLTPIVVNPIVLGYTGLCIFLVAFCISNYIKKTRLSRMVYKWLGTNSFVVDSSS